MVKNMMTLEKTALSYKKKQHLLIIAKGGTHLVLGMDIVEKTEGQFGSEGTC